MPVHAHHAPKDWNQERIGQPPQQFVRSEGVMDMAADITGTEARLRFTRAK